MTGQKTRDLQARTWTIGSISEDRLNDITGIWQSCFMLMFAIVAAALAWMHYAIRKAERVEWAAQTEQTDLPELASPQLFYPMNRHPVADAAMRNSDQHG